MLTHRLRKSQGRAMKVVINKCYGGFGLSDAAFELISKYAGIPIVDYSEKADRADEYERRPMIFRGGLSSIRGQELWGYTPERNDPHLVRVVEELGDKASGPFANLQITDIPDGIEWEIGEYDGQEWVDEVHRSWH